MRSLAKELKSGKKVTVAGWVNSRRDHGGLIFIDLRDHTGVVQLVIDPKAKAAFELAETVRDEFVLRATGKVRERAEDLKNPNIPTGDIELVVEEEQEAYDNLPESIQYSERGDAMGEYVDPNYKPPVPTVVPTTEGGTVPAPSGTDAGSSTSDGGNGNDSDNNSNGAIATGQASLAVIVFIVLVAGIGVFFFSRRKYQK